MPERPDILLIMGDERPVFMTGCYGHRSAKTPNLDRCVCRPRFWLRVPAQEEPQE